MIEESSDGRHRDEHPVVEGVRRFLVAEDGSTAIEYSLIAALIALMLVGFLTSFGNKLSGYFLTLAGAIQTS